MRQLPLATLAVLLGGCMTVGPDFEPPAPTWDAEWKGPSLEGVGDGPAAAAWWENFRDPALDALIVAAEAGNPGLDLAGLRVLEARAQLAVAGALRVPQASTVTAGAGYGAAARAGRRVADSDFAFATAGLEIGWELDFWGRFRRAIESADAAYFASIANFEDGRLVLRAEVARVYFAHRTLQERLAIVQQNLVLQRRSVEITELLFRRGAESELDVQQARTQLLATEASVPQLEAGIVQTRNALALLLGRPPGPLPELALSPPQLPLLPQGLTADIPADVLRRRPDVRAAALRAGALSAQIGLARAELYPSLALGGSFSLTGTRPGLGNAVDIALGPLISWSFPDFGRVRNNVRVQDARFQQALVGYRESVLRAATEVDNGAIGFVKAREENAVLADAQRTARRSLDLATLQYREGMADFQRVLDAQAGLLRQQERYVANRGQVASSLVDLYKALGGGWSPAVEADFADPATRATMKARTDWGRLLDMPEETP
jgi:NodT family efflux transporter outer membrane factor (OMF) lipoprotein